MVWNTAEQMRHATAVAQKRKKRMRSCRSTNEESGEGKGESVTEKEKGGSVRKL